ncbi:hypothetical protein [Cupriavidus basilensis]
MRCHERLLADLEKEMHERRDAIIAAASDLDALGEVLSTAHYDDISCSIAGVTASGKLQAYASTGHEAALLHFLLTHGASVAEVRNSAQFDHYHLIYPGISSRIVLLTPAAITPDINPGRG